MGLVLFIVAVFEIHMVYVVQAVLELKNPPVADSQMLEFIHLVFSPLGWSYPGGMTVNNFNTRQQGQCRCPGRFLGAYEINGPHEVRYSWLKE